MKKFLMLAAAVCAATGAYAEGYQVNSFSAKQQGMGHVGVAMKLGAESQIFNPAAMAFSDKTFEVSGAVSAIMPTATTHYKGTDYGTDNKASTPFNVSTAWKVYDNFYAGVTMYTPYGSSINWGDNWPGAVLNQSVDLKMFTVQPTLSWRVLPNLSVGAGLMIAWGNVDLNKGLVSPASMDVLLAAMQVPVSFNGVTPASVNLKGDAAVACGINIGAMWDVTSNVSIGASFRSKMSMKVKKGDATVTYANDAARQFLGETLDNLNYTNFSATMPAPYVFTAGVSYKPVDRLILAFDAQLSGWKTYKTLDIEFDQLPAYNQNLRKDYHNSMTYHIGAQYGVTSRLDLRCGFMIDCTPCNKDYYNPETPGMTKIEPSVGLSFRPLPSLSIDAAFLYIKGTGMKNATGQYEDFIAKSYPQLGMPAEATFTADYNVHAIAPAFGITYSF